MVVLESKGSLFKVTYSKVKVKLLILELVDVCLIFDFANWFERTFSIDIKKVTIYKSRSSY